MRPLLVGLAIGLASLGSTACSPAPSPLPIIRIEPESPNTSENLTAVVENYASTDGWIWEWSLNGQVTDQTNQELPNGRTARGHVWSVVGRPSPTGPEGTAETTIVNAKPIVVLTPRGTRWGSADDLIVDAQTQDLDGDRVEVDYRWLRDGALTTLDTRTVESTRTRRGQTWVVIATPNDGIENGEPARVEFTIDNALPEIDGVQIEPADPISTTPLLAVPGELYDFDDDEVTVRYRWQVDGTTVEGVDGDTLGTEHFAKGRIVIVEATPNDGMDDGRPALSAAVTIGNAPPSRPVQPTLSPAEPMPEDDLVCTLPSPSADPDGDAVEYVFAWIRNDEEHTTVRTADLSVTLSQSETTGGERWTCQVSAIDSDDGLSEPSPESEEVRIFSPRDGTVRTVGGEWLDVIYVRCSSGTTCNATQARNACRDVGAKVVSHASNGTDTVRSLGATVSCNWSISYFTVDRTMPSNTCLIGISNLDWSSCCGTGSWHGNTVAFGAAGATFGFVNTSNSGYVSSFPNVGGSTWGCNSESTNAPLRAGCTEPHVACVRD